MPMSMEGKVYDVKGMKIRLFPISVLARELTKTLKEERTTQTIRKWEASGILPKHTFANGQKRLYSMEQIKTICKIAKEEKIRQGYAMSLTNFSTRVHEELFKINQKYKEDIKKDDKRKIDR